MSSRRVFPRFTTVLVLTLLFSAIALSHEKKGAKTAVTGRVVDSACYFGHGSQGADHVACATACAKKGIPLVILDAATETLYLPLAANHHEPANDSLLEFIDREVTITGTVTEKNGMKAIMMEKIELAEKAGTDSQ